MEMAADAVEAMKPKIFYPYRYGDTDISELKELLRASREPKSESEDERDKTWFFRFICNFLNSSYEIHSGKDCEPLSPFSAMAAAILAFCLLDTVVEAGI